MKKNDWIYALTVLVFSLLFWKQSTGLNILIMNLFLIAGVLIVNKSVMRNRNWWFASLGALVSAFSVFLYGDVISLFTNFASLLLVSAFVIEKENSMLVSLFQSLCNLFVTIAYIFVDGFARRSKRLQEGGEKRSTAGKRTWIVLGALVVVTVFFFLYRGSNVLFYKLTEKINLDFISFGWIAFTGGGALIMYAFYYYHALPGVSEWDRSHSLTLVPAEKESWMDKLMSMPTEKFSAIVLLSLLNVLLLVVNSLDGLFIFGGTKLPQGVTYTEYVHQGIGMLIASIILAMLIILYYFRGRLNFVQDSKLLRNLALTWIAQNAFMLVSNMIRNEMYVDAYGLTYKRIGVYIYLLLALIGLCTTGWKVIFRKTNTFLFRSNSWLFYAVLVASCLVNWDERIAKHNVMHTGNFDADYIATLSYRAYPELVNYYAKHPEIQIPADVQEKLIQFESKQRFIFEENKWQSKTVYGARVYNQIKNFKTGIPLSQIDLRKKDLKQIYYFPSLSAIESADYSENDLTNLGEVGKYSKLKRLVLDGNRDLSSLEGIQSLKSLEEISMNDTKIREYGPLLSLPNLRLIQVEKISREWRQQLEARFPGIEIRDSYSFFNF